MYWSVLSRFQCDVFRGRQALACCATRGCPSDTAIPRRRNSEILRNAKPVLPLTSQRVSDACSDSGVRLITIESAKERSLAHSEANLQIDAAFAMSVAYVIYTSGSTGEPKGACVPLRATLRLVLNTSYISVQCGHRVAYAGHRKDWKGQVQEVIVTKHIPELVRFRTNLSSVSRCAV